jgi:hypothetical protein
MFLNYFKEEYDMYKEGMVQESVKKIESALLWDLALCELNQIEQVLRDIYDDAYEAGKDSVDVSDLVDVE